MKNQSTSRFITRSAVTLCMSAALGCSALLPNALQTPGFHSLDSVASTPHAVAAPNAAAPTLLVSSPHAASGFDSRHMIYVRTAHKLEYFARNEWIDTPARMLAPLLATSLTRSGSFRAVVLMPSMAAGDINLDTEIVRLQQEFDTPGSAGRPSHVRFTLNATLLDSTTRRVIVSREFESRVAAPSNDPAGGVVAANQAVQIVLDQVSEFCAEAVRSWKLAASSKSSGIDG